MQKFYIWILTVILLFSGCTTARNIYNAQGSLFGSWTYKDSNAVNKVVMTLKKDGTYILDTNSNGKRDIWGRYTVFYNQIKFQDDAQSNSASICFEPGVFEYEIIGSDMYFKVIADQCTFRRYALDAVWTKVKSKK